MTGKQNKREIRDKCREAAKGLSAEYRTDASREIERKILDHPWYQAAKTVFVFVGMPAEPDTRGIIDRALKDGKRVCVPRCGERPRMDAAEIRSREELRPGALGIPAPGDDAPTVDPAEIDLALIPCVAAGRDMSRLGHGAGYYDVYLPQTHAKKVCLCFEKLLTDGIPMTDEDVPMDAVITEQCVYT